MTAVNMPEYGFYVFVIQENTGHRTFWHILHSECEKTVSSFSAI